MSVLAASGGYPLLDAFWTMFIFFAWVLWFWLLFTILGDLFSRHDLSGWAKTGWVVGLLILPFIGTFIYIISQGSDMAARRQADTQAAQQNFDEHVRAVAASSNGHGDVDQISRAKELLDSGAITPAEFDTIKQKALASV